MDGTLDFDLHDGGPPTRSDLLARLAALEGTLASVAVIERAKGALMVTYGLSADAAFALLRFHSQTRNVKIRAIADELSTLLATSRTSSEGMARFDRLLDDVALGLQKSSASVSAEGSRTALASAAEQPLTAPSPDELSQVMLRSVATAPPGITVAANTPDKPLIYVNDAFADLTGYPIREVVGRNCRFLQGPGTDPKSIATLKRAMRDGRDVSVVLRNYRRDGTQFWNEVSISPVRDHAGQITHYVGTQIDVTERVGARG